MRNLITVFALLVSVTGIFVSLAREELRCKLGLNSEECAKALQKKEPIREAIAPDSNNVATPVRRSQVSTEKTSSEKAVPVLESQPKTELSTIDKTIESGEKTADTTGQKMLKPTAEKQVEMPSTNDQATSITPEIPAHESSQMDTSNNSENNQTTGNAAPNTEQIPVIAPPLLQPKSE